jgi:MFS family permease
VEAVGSDQRGVHPLERETIKRVIRRLMPLLMLGYFCAYLDRVNVGMAASTMMQQLGFSSTVFGFGAGLFFIGYFVAEIPSNLILDRFGARRWIARILITWGVISGLTAFVWNDWSFYAVRLLLGLAEAGFFPGVVLYLTWWFPAYYRTRMMAMFYSSVVVSNIIGQPISGLLLHMDGMLGLHGWQWLFVIESLPSIIMSFVIWQFLTDRPADAEWLRPDQRAWLTDRLASERAEREAIHKFSLAGAFAEPRIWLLTIAYVGLNAANYGVLFFLPLIVKGLGVSTNLIGVVSALPFLFALFVMNIWGWHCDYTGERTWHIAGPCFVIAGGMAACSLIGVGHPVIIMVALIFSQMGQQCAAVTFWSLPTALLSGTAAAGGIAMINATGSLGGWLGPWMFGLVKDLSGSDNIALLFLALTPIACAAGVIATRHDRRLERIPTRI